MAGRIANDFIDELRSRTDIVDIISGYMHLTPRGNRYWGLCPFHGEKTPSFSVDRQRQFFYCFGCHEGGNVFQFLMAQERIEFIEAVRMLADRAGMKVPEDEGGARIDSSLRKKAIEAATEAARFYRDVLVSPEGEQAMRYVLGREISPRAISRFGIGFSPDGWDRLYAHLKQKGFEEQELLAAGLIVRKNDKYFDMFRNRVMFPIFSRSGQVIAFGGRIIGDGQPKYLNSSETPIFNKRHNLYGLNFLKGVRDLKELILVEGYVDVVSLASHGVTNCVATLGTAITQEQARLMKNYCSAITVCYDGDAAGQNATVRALSILKAAGIDAKVVVLPDGQDPDDFVRKSGANAYRELARMSGAQYLLDREKSGYDLSAQEGRAGYAIAASRVLKSVDQPVVLEGYLRQLMVDTGYSRDVLLEQIGRSVPALEKGDIISKPSVHNSYKKAMLPDYVKAQRALIALMASDAQLPEGLVSIEDFSDETCRALAQVLLSEPGRKGKAAYMMEAVGEDGALRSEAALILSEQENFDPGGMADQVRQYLRSIQIHQTEERIKELAASMEGLDQQGRAQAMEQLNQHMKRLRLLKDRRD